MLTKLPNYPTITKERQRDKHRQTKHREQRDNLSHHGHLHRNYRPPNLSGKKSCVGVPPLLALRSRRSTPRPISVGRFY